jgi:hypothetical protein
MRCPPAIEYMLVDATSYRSQRNRELEGICGVSAQFPGVAVSASTREMETKMLQQKILSERSTPTSWHRKRGDLASVRRGSRRCLDR